MEAKKKSRDAAEELGKGIDNLRKKNNLTAAKHLENTIAILKQPDPVDHDQSDQSVWYLNKDWPLSSKPSPQPCNNVMDVSPIGFVGLVVSSTGDWFQAT